MTEPPSTIHPTYRHLDRPVRLAGLTLAHWVQLVLAGAVAYGVAQLLPFSPTWSLSIATTLAGTPLAVSIGAASGTTPDPVAYARALWRWRRNARVYVPPGVGTRADAIEP